MAAYEDISKKLGGLDPFDGPVPGESLTSSPEQRMPYEKAPEYTNLEEAVEGLFNRLIQEDTLDEYLDLMRQGIPLEMIAQVTLFSGFREGKWNPDLLLLMVEPTIYILLALSEYAGIDAVLYPEESMEEDEDEDFEEELNKARSFSDIVKSGPEDSNISIEGMERPAAVSQSIMDRIQQTAKEA